MKTTHNTPSIPSLPTACLVFAALLASAATGQAPPAAPPLIRQMAGTWDVRQRMWPGAGAQAVPLPPAIARRRLIGGAFLEEVMTAAPGPKPQPFTRIACLNYNAVSRKYEYFSVDTRAPQMMNERSASGVAPGAMYGPGVLALSGGRFVAPRWGKAVNAAFQYRLTVGAVVNAHQTVRLYLTPVSGGKAAEFLAFEYVYTRRH